MVGNGTDVACRGAGGHNGGVKVLLRNPKRELEVPGPVNVLALVRKLGYTREAVLVIVDGTLVTGDATIAEGSEVEVRPVVSGGAR